MTDGLDIRFERSQSIVGTIIEGSVFLLDERGKRLHTLNRMGTFIWGLLESGSTLREIIRKVSYKFGISEEAAGSRTRQFLGQLAEKGAVQVFDSARHGVR